LKMNPLILPLGAGLARALGWKGISNPYLVISMLFSSLALWTFLIIYEIKCLKNMGNI